MGQMFRPRHFATLRRLVTARDSGGELAETWEDLPRVVATFEPVRGTEAMQDGREAGTITARVQIRYREDVTPAMRVVLAGAEYNIHAAIDQDGRRRWLWLDVSEVAE